MCQCYFTSEAVAQETDAGCFDVLLLALVPVCHAARTLGDMARERERRTQGGKRALCPLFPVHVKKLEEELEQRETTVVLRCAVAATGKRVTGGEKRMQ